MTTLPVVIGRPACPAAGPHDAPYPNVAAWPARGLAAWARWRETRRQRLCEAGLRRLARELSPALRRDLGLPGFGD